MKKLIRFIFCLFICSGFAGIPVASARMHTDNPNAEAHSHHATSHKKHKHSRIKKKSGPTHHARKHKRKHKHPI